MKKLSIYATILLILGLTACQNQTNASADEEGKLSSKTPVQVVSIVQGAIKDSLTLLGRTAYLKRNIVSAPIPAFIKKVNVNLGDKVHKGDILYVLQSKESVALGDDISKIDTSLTHFGIIEVAASATGAIFSLDKQQSGDYVLEGTQLCAIAESSDLIFQIEFPIEYVDYAKIGSKCTIVLPDKSTYSTTFIKALEVMNITSQTQTFLTQANTQIILPENMIVKAIVHKKGFTHAQLLPKSCVLSDEMMRSFWVMKVINDSTAVKIPVTIGNKDDKNIEIQSPRFQISDQLILTGNYGLTDTAAIEIIK